MTCSTFVLAVFEAAGVDWLDISTWKTRPKDDERHDALLAKMEAGIPEYNIPPAPPEHIRKVRAELPCIRVRPEEVAAAGMADQRPLVFEQAERCGRWILERLTSGAEHASI